MNFLVLVSTLSLMQFTFFGALVARARRAHGVAAPAMSGHPSFERLNRVHANTLERLALFLPLLWMAGQFWPQPAMAALGAVFLVGRLLYWRGYVREPQARSLGNAVTMAAIAALLLATLAGLARSVLA
jgi:glutathione S-transferase